MKFHLAALMLCRLARGFSPSAGPLRARGLYKPQSARTSIRPATTPPTTTNIPPLARDYGTSGSSKRMILRPDWEREGRVFGLDPLKKKDRAFEYLVEYPCNFEIKVIGVNEGTFAADIAATVSIACEVCYHSIQCYLCRAYFSSELTTGWRPVPLSSRLLHYRDVDDVLCTTIQPSHTRLTRFMSCSMIY